ncbi:mandelate racemase/muconate lactonizing enzyme family protein [bacterium]
MIEPLDIEVAHVFETEIPLVAPDGTETGKTVVNVVVNLVTINGIGGWGCAAPVTDATGEKMEDMLEAARDVLAPAVADLPPRPLWEVLKAIEDAAPEAPAARSAFDIAIHDIWCKELGASMQALLGVARHNVETAAAVEEMDPNRAVEEAGGHMERGFKILRVMGGQDHKEDIARIKEIRRDYGRGVRMRLDARGGYTPDQAREVLEELEKDIELFEQPVGKDERDALAELAGESPVTVAADESAATEKEAMELLGKGVPVVKVKLSKCGGLAPALRICEFARVAGGRVSVGCGIETEISATAAAHVAICRPSADIADLDRHLLLGRHAVSGGLKIEEGLVTLPARPGLGVNVRKNYLKT